MSFPKDTIEEVWKKGHAVLGFDEKFIRKDCCGAWIVRNQYGNRDDTFGWEIDHVFPEALGGDDSLDNLRPMQWQNNNSKGDDYPHYTSAVKANGNYNIEVNKRCTVNSALQEKIKRMYKI